MKPLSCRCGRAVYFRNQRCGNCQRQLAFDAESLTMRCADEPGADIAAANLCANRTGPIRCNWFTHSGTERGLCLSCRTSRIIPSLEKDANHELWRRLEIAKRHLLYDLLSLGLPIDTSSLRFEFKEDQRTNPNVVEEHVSTGHANGVITINVAEADSVFRERMRQRMREPFRTLLGHMRHESGHYYFDIVIGDDRLAEARELFGDERADYTAALKRHYADGPSENWWQNHISNYAAAHPMEDWAETWAHFLHITAVLETAESHDLLPAGSARPWHATFVDLALKLNEVSRSLGLPDQYPFTLSPVVLRKLDFVRNVVADYVAAARSRGDKEPPAA